MPMTLDTYLADGLSALLVAVEGKPDHTVHEVRAGLSRPRLVRVVLARLRQAGFTFRFFTQKEETDKRMGGPSGFCQWFMMDPATGAFTPSRVLAISRETNSLDAFRVAVHELAHVYTLTEARLEREMKKAKTMPRLMETNYYHWGEIVADSVAYLVAVTAAPEQQGALVKAHASYLVGWRDAASTMQNPDTRATILNTARMILGAIHTDLTSGQE